MILMRFGGCCAREIPPDEAISETENPGGDENVDRGGGQVNEFPAPASESIQEEKREREEEGAQEEQVQARCRCCKRI